MTEEQSLKLRRELEELDRQILALVNQRARKAAQMIRNDPAGHTGPFGSASEIEAKKIIREENRGPLTDEHLAVIWKEITSACVNNEPSGLVVALGPETGSTFRAARAHFGGSARIEAQSSICEVFRLVERDQAVLGVVPVENSLTGLSHATLDRMIDTELNVVGEIIIPVRYCLLGNNGGLEGITRVAGKSHCLELCRQWLRTNLPGAELVETRDTALAADLCREDPRAAFISSPAAVDIHGLPILAMDIEDSRHNQSRCLILGKGQMPSTGQDKTSILFVTRHQPGALLKALQVMADHGINLTRIESRPTRNQPWDYYFFADFEGHGEEERVLCALNALGREASLVKVFGSYAKAITQGA